MSYKLQVFDLELDQEYANCFQLILNTGELVRIYLSNKLAEMDLKDKDLTEVHGWIMKRMIEAGVNPGKVKAIQLLGQICHKDDPKEEATGWDTLMMRSILGGLSSSRGCVGSAVEESPIGFLLRAAENMRSEPPPDTTPMQTTAPNQETTDEPPQTSGNDTPEGSGSEPAP